MVISYDEILRELITGPHLIKLDTNKKAWGQIEISPTILQLENFLDDRGPEAPPIFFLYPSHERPDPCGQQPA